MAGARVKFLAQGNTAAAENRTRAPNLERHDWQAGALPTELLLPPYSVSTQLIFILYPSKINICKVYSGDRASSLM